MAWMELSIDTTSEAIDWVRSLLATTDYTNGLYITKYSESNLRHSPDSTQVEPEQTDQPWTFSICLYLPYDSYARTRAEKLVNQLSPLHRTGLTTAFQTTVVAEKPEHTEAFEPPAHRIGQQFVVLPADAPDSLADANEVPLKLDATLAFGSGLHPATIVSLKLLERYVRPGMTVLDLGSGSGILSVAMAKLGAQVLALDNDTIAVQATQNAVRCNGVEHQVTVKQGSLGHGSDLGHWLGGDSITNVPVLEPTPTFDLIVANILARVHIALAHDFRNALFQTADPGVNRILVTAGFTTEQEQEVHLALAEAGFEPIDCERLNEWVALAHCLKNT